MSSSVVPPSAAWPPPAAHPVVTPIRPAPQSAGSGFRILRSLISLGPGGEHQLAVIADAAGLHPPHASKLLQSAILEHLVERGQRRGTYRLTREGAALGAPAPVAATTTRIRTALQNLYEDTGLAAAWHEPTCRPGDGLRLEYVDAVGRMPLRQPPDVRTSAAGRVLLAYLPRSLAFDADDRPLLLPDQVREMILAARIARSRTATTHTLAAPVLRGRNLIGVLSITGANHRFADSTQVQEHAAQLRRAAAMAGCPVAPRRSAGPVLPEAGTARQYA